MQTNADTESVYRDQILGRLPPNTVCRSALILKNSLIAIQIYSGSLPDYESCAISLYHSKTSKPIKTFQVKMPQKPSNLQQHSLLVDPSGKFLIVCDDYGLFIYSLECSLKLFSRLSLPTSRLKLTIPCSRIAQPLTKVRVINSEELLIAKGSSLLKWNFFIDKSVTQPNEFITFPQEKKITDFESDADKQLLFVMTELLFTYEGCEVTIYDMADRTPLSTYKLSCMFINRFWNVDLEIGSLSILQSDLVSKASTVTFVRINPDFEMQTMKSYDVDGWTLNHLNTSKKISCVIVTQMLGDALKRIWGYFEHAEDKFLKVNYSVAKVTSETEPPRLHKFFEYFDRFDCFIGHEEGTVFMTRRDRVIKRKSGYSSKKFWEGVKPGSAVNS